MQFIWKVPPLGHQVELRLGSAGREEVIVDGFSVLTHFSSELRSEHVLPIEGADVRIIITRNRGVVPSAELLADGRSIDAEPSGRAPTPVASASTPPAGAAHPQTQLISVVVMGIAGLGGVLASRVFGPMLIIPSLVGIGAFAILKRNVHGPGAPYIGAAALIWGHMSWIAVGILIVGNVPGLEWAIVLGLAAAAALLVARPSWTLALLLVVAEGYLLYANLDAYHRTGGSQMRAAIVLHVILRLAAMVALMIGAWLARPEDAPQAYSSTAPPEPYPSAPSATLRAPSAVSQAHSTTSRASAPPLPFATQPVPSSRAAPVMTASRPAHHRWSINPKLAAGIVVGLVAGAATLAGLYRPRASSSPQAVASGSPVTGSVFLAGREEYHLVTVTVGDQRADLDERGRFVARDVPTGTHQVRASALSTLEGEVSVEVVVSGRPGEEVRAPLLSLTPVAKVKGRLLIEDAFGGPSRPVKGARVQVARTSLETHTDAQGGFVLEVPPQPTLFQALVEGHPMLEKSLALRWAPALLDFPRLPPVTNSRCAPSAAGQGEGSRDLVGPGEVRPDGTRDYVFRVVPCREGIIQRVQLLQRADSWTRWDTTPGLHGALGVAAQAAPDTLLNRGQQLAAPVSRGDVLAIHLAQAPAPKADLELLLEYDDQSVDRVELRPSVSVHGPY